MNVGDIVAVKVPTGGMSKAPLVVRSLPDEDDQFVRVDYLRPEDDPEVLKRKGLGFDPGSLELVSPGARSRNVGVGPGHTDANGVITEAQLIAKQAMDRCARDEEWLHNNGYHSYSTAMANFRVKIESALGELVDELMP